MLIVEDDSDFASALKEQLEVEGYRARTASCRQEALDSIRAFEAQVALIDIRLGEETGMGVVSALMAVRPRIVCTLMTAHATLESAIEAADSGAQGYLRKPIDPDELRASLDRSFEIIALRDQRERAEEALHDRDRHLEVLRTALYGAVSGLRRSRHQETHVDPVVSSPQLEEYGTRAVDEAGRVTWANARHQELLGWRLEDIVGRPVDEVEAIASIELVGARMQALGKGWSHSARCGQRHADGRIVSTNVTCVPMVDRGGRYRGYCALLDHARQVQRSGFALGSEPKPGTANDAPIAAAPSLEVLSNRQREIVEQALLGGSTEEIAENLGISAHTVRNHLKAIYRKLAVNSRAQLTACLYGARRGHREV